MERLTRIRVALVGLAILAVAASGLAQNMPAKHLQLIEINVKSGAEGQFEDYVKKIIEAADKVGAPQGWTFAQPVMGGRDRLITCSFSSTSSVNGTTGRCFPRC